ncbi:type VI secretion protein IcmF/TssM N-terminal domain-containing protein [Zymobacter sp. IVIA_5232.4 C2]|uniref:type VI secretion protein IcmF/TssM N-terminal domain-containing protein n=1 Tax=Zymobacter sp. IVIA_5232.4 C2 TaxID=3394855 RepID=UPI0039C1D3AD
MKRLLRLLKNFWLVSIALWIVVALASVWTLFRFYPETGREARWIAVALVSAVWLLAVVLRQYRRIRAERNIESLVEREVDRSVMSGQHDETEYDALRRRLKHVIERLRANRTAGGRGQTALSELPWYLVIGLPSSGKTSLLGNAGLNASVVGGSAMAGQSGTQSCDWYFSPEAVMIDTAGRYITDDQAASEFSEFLKLLRRQRRQAINGLVMVVSLPDLLGMSPEERGALARQLLDRASRYRKALHTLPPIYLFFSKADLLPGFEQTFDGLDAEARQQPWGMTFSVDEIRNAGIPNVFPGRFDELMRGLEGHVQQRAAQMGQRVENAMLRFPDYMAELRNVLGDFLSPFDATRAEEDVPAVRGVYFTSALQTENRLPSILDEHVRTTFGLQEQGSGDWVDNDPGSRIGERRYFITGVFRSVVFPDRYLSRHIAQGGRLHALSPWTLGAGLLVGTAAIAAGATSYIHHHRALNQLDDELTQASPCAEERLNVLADQLHQFNGGSRSPLPFDRELGLDPTHRLQPMVEDAYFTGLKQQALVPVSNYLASRLHQLDALAQATQSAAESQQAAPRNIRNGKTARRVAQQTREGRQRAREQLMQPQGVARVTSLGDVRSQVQAQTLGRVQDAANSVRSDLQQGLSDGTQHLRESGLSSLRSLHQGSNESDAVNPALSRALTDNRLTPEQVAQLDESYNALKLYLILAEPEKHATAEDVRFVNDTLPQVWKTVAEQQGESISDDDIQRHVAVYAGYLQRRHAPALGRDEALVERARLSLKGFLNDQSLVDRKYLQFQQEVRQRYQSLTLASMVPGNSRQLLYSGESVPAIYTKKVWDEYLRREILDAAATDLRVETDWVLDDSGSAERMESKTTFVRQLMARYKHDYIEAWERFLGATGVRRFDSIDTANSRLSLLSDAQQSPIRQLMLAVRDNTRWDAPLDNALLNKQNGQDSRGFWGKAMDVFSSDDGSIAQARMSQISDLPGFHDGVLADHFAQVNALFENDSSDAAANKDAVMDRYLRELRQLKVRFDNMRRSQDVGKASKELISATLANNGNTEFTVVRNDIAANIDISDAALPQALQHLFSDPVERAWETLYAPAGQQLARAWGSRVDTPWKQKIADRYPLANSGNEASIRDLRDFVDPNSGRLVAFNRDEIGALEEGDFDNMLVDPRMQETIRNGTALGAVIDSLADPQNGFEIMVEPSPYMTQIMLTVDGQVQDYRNGPQPWQHFTWPGDLKHPGARLEVTTLDNQRYTVANFPTRWGLLRMIDTAEVQDVDAVRQRFVWQTPAGPVSFIVRNFGGIRLTDLKKVHALTMPRLSTAAPEAAAPAAEASDEGNDSSVVSDLVDKATDTATKAATNAATSAATDAASKAAESALGGVTGTSL